MPLALKERKGSTAEPKQARKSHDPDDFRAPLHEHLDELRVRVFRSVGAIAVCWFVGWFLMPPAINAIVARCFAEFKVIPKVVWNGITEPFMSQLKVSFIIGLCIALPYVTTQIWGFVAPGLKEHEKKPIRTVAPISILLFFLGVGFCWIVLPQAFAWFGSFLGQYPMTELLQNQQELVLFAVKMMAAFGVCFQLPLIVFVLGKIGILSPETLMEHWRHATVFIFFVSAAITPSNDPASMLMMAIPLCILFAISVYAVKLTTKGSRKVEDDLPLLD